MTSEHCSTQKKETISVLIVEPGKEPQKKEIESTLESLQHEVGGYIEAVYPFKEPAAIIVNEEGKLNGLPLNRALRDEDGKIYDIIAGTFIIAGLTEDDFGSLEEKYIRQFTELFHDPEQFVKIGQNLFVVPRKTTQSKQKEITEPEL